MERSSRITILTVSMYKTGWLQFPYKKRVNIRHTVPNTGEISEKYTRAVHDFTITFMLQNITYSDE